MKKDISIALIEQKYSEGKSQSVIGHEMGVSQWVISSRMREHGLTILPKTRKLGQRKYSLNENALDLLDTKTAWILGWLLADGFVARDNCFGIKVAIKDLDILEKIKHFFEYTGPILDANTYLKKTGKTYKIKLLKINSIEIKNKLLEYGIAPNKTSNEKYLRLPKDEEIDRHFIKGVFEGDGSLLYYKKSNRSRFQIVGTKELLNEIQKKLILYVGIKKTKMYCQSEKSNHYMMQYSGNKQVRRIASWIYKNSEWHLDRKYKAYKEMVNL